MNPQSALENLTLAVATLKRAGVRAFLVDGTLLGAVRERKFIAHDRDVDLGVFIGEHQLDLPIRLEAVGLRHTRTYGTVERGLQYAFRRNSVKVDTFFYYTDDAGHYHAAWKDGEPIRYSYPPFALAPLSFLGAQWLAPADPEAFLVAKYGPDWRTPVTEWDWAWGPRNASAWSSAA